MPGPEGAVRAFLADVEDHDVALLDCPPGLCGCAWEAVLAADHVLVPFRTQDAEILGVDQIARLLDSARSRGGEARLLEYVPSMTRRHWRLDSACEAAIRARHGEVFSTGIPNAAEFQWSSHRKGAIIAHGPRGRVGNVMMTLAQEIMARVGAA